jgi:hypothetical protein
LRTVHADTSMHKFRTALEKLKSEHITGGNDVVKVKLIIENYDSFLEAKKVLDSINNKFADAD